MKTKSSSSPSEVYDAPPAMAHFALDPGKDIGGDFCLYTSVRGNRVKLSKKLPETLGAERLKKIWEGAKKIVPEGSSNLYIDFSRLLVHYRDVHKDDKTIDLCLPEQSPQELREEIMGIRKKIKEVWTGSFHSYFDETGVRAIRGNAPFALPLESWQNLLAKRSLKEYFTSGFFSGISGPELEPSRLRKNFGRIVAAEKFLLLLHHFISEDLGEGEEKALQELLQGPDRYAIFSALALAPEKPFSDLSEEEKLEAASKASRQVFSHLHLVLPKQDPPSSEFSFTTRLKKFLGKEISSPLFLEPIAREYAADVGSCYLDERVPLSAWADQNNTTYKKRSIVDFVVQAVLKMEDPNFSSQSFLEKFGFKAPLLTKFETFLKDVPHELSPIREKAEASYRESNSKKIGEEAEKILSEKS